MIPTWAELLDNRIKVVKTRKLDKNQVSNYTKYYNWPMCQLTFRRQPPQLFEQV